MSAATSFPAEGRVMPIPLHAEQAEGVSAGALRLERWGIFVVSSTTFLALAALLVYRYRVYVGDALSRAYGAASVFFASSPSLANIGFIWSPLPSLVQMPFVFFAPFFRNGFTPNIPTALFAAGALVLLNEVLRPWLPERRYRWPLLMVYQFHPMILLYSINGMAEQIEIFFTLGCLLLFQKLLFADWTFQSHLRAFFMGALAAAGFLTRYEGIVLGGVFGVNLAIAPVVLRRWRIPAEIEAALLSYATPFTYAIFLWLFFNWTIMGDPLFFTSTTRSSDIQFLGTLASPQVANAIHNPAAAAAYVLLATLYVLPTALLAGLGLVIRLAFRRDPYAVLFFMLILSVPLFQVALHVVGQTGGYLRYQIYNIPITAISMAYLAHELRPRVAPRFSMPIVWILMLAGAIAFLSSLYRPDYLEDWAEALIPETIALTESGQYQELAHRDDLPTQVQARAIAARILDLPNPGRILVDERYAEKAIVFSGDLRRFLSSRDPGFRAAVTNPGAYVAYVLVQDLPPGSSLITDAHPQLFAQGGTGLELVGDWQGQTAHWRLYEVQAP